LDCRFAMDVRWMLLHSVHNILEKGIEIAKIPFHLLQLSTCSNQESRMKLKDIQLTDPVDLAILENTKEMWISLVRSGEVDNVNPVVVKVNDDRIVTTEDDEDDGFFTAEIKGKEEYLLYAVFVLKIRRDNAGLEHATLQEQRKWYEMAHQFVVEFGEDRTPPDIVVCMKGCADHLDRASGN